MMKNKNKMTCSICKREIEINYLSATIHFDVKHTTLYKYPKELNLCSGCACWLYKDVIEPEMKVYES